MNEALGTFLGGIGIFFVGMHLLKNGLAHMTGRKLRMALSRVVGRKRYAGPLGLVVGLVSQSRSAITFVTGSMVAGGLMTVRQALPVVFWANVGCGGLVLLAFLDIKVLILFLIGVAGICAAFETPSRLKHLAWGVFGLGLLFYGLGMIKAGAIPMAESHWIADHLADKTDAYLAALLIGAALTAITQSSSGVSILGITMAFSGLLSYGQVLMLIYGTGLGSSVSVALLSLRMRGSLKQLVMGQVLFNVVGVCVFVPLFYAEVGGHLPAMHALLTGPLWKVPVAQQMALAYILYNLVCATVLTAGIGPYSALLKRLWPPTKQEQWSRMKFLHDQALADPDTAIVLLEKEQARLLERLPRYVHALRGDTAPAELEELHGAFDTVATEIESFTSELLGLEHDAEDSSRVLRVQNRQTLLRDLEYSVHALCKGLVAWDDAPNAGTGLRDVFAESLDLILLTAADAAAAGAPQDALTLVQLTGDKGGALEQMRKHYLSGEGGMDTAERMAFLRTTGRFERAAWAANRLGRILLRGNGDAATGSAPVHGVV